MKILLLGADGMVGSGVSRTLSERHTVIGTTRSRCPVDDLYAFERAITSERPDLIVNCIGIVPQRTKDVTLMLRVNALFPLELRRVWKGPMIQISTDCAKDATAYGMSKFLGEIGMTLRTCVVGFCPRRPVSLLDWFVFKSGNAVPAWGNAFFTPITNRELGRAVHAAAMHYREGVFEVGGERQSKLGYLTLINEAYRLQKILIPQNDPRVDKSLDSEAFTRHTGWTPHNTLSQIHELAIDGSIP